VFPSLSLIVAVEGSSKKTTQKKYLGKSLLFLLILVDNQLLHSDMAF